MSMCAVTQSGWRISSSLFGSFPSMHLLTPFLLPGYRKQNNKTQPPLFFFSSTVANAQSKSLWHPVP